MAFNFNWTPLIASASSPEFYSHAKELLTLALNKSAKSSVIVDSDVAVENLHLGHSAPELEVLEIGDLAEDRFRGVFRMTYAGDAQVTVKARVQINPLCTYLTTSPDFTSPHPLAVAATPLSIPVRLTLSEFKLSGFVILVFSKEKGITLVFRNDPLESMKVQSSFDSIPFIKDYLQREIERQVRGVFQEELPLAVYKLSLRLLEPDGRAPVKDENTVLPAVEDGEEDVEEDLDLLFAGESADAPSVSEKNMLCLHTLRNSQATLSLFTPSINGVIYRATPPSSLDQVAQTSAGTPMADSPLRPGLHQSSSTMSLGTPGRRKKKHRIVNLRKGKESTTTTTTTPTPTSEKPIPSSTPTTPESATPTTTSSAPEYFSTRPRKLSLVEDHSLPSRLPPPQTPPAAHTRPAIASSQTPRSRPDYSILEDRPRLSRGQKYPSPIVEKAFMMRFMAEMNRQAEERQRY